MVTRSDIYTDGASQSRAPHALQVDWSTASPQVHGGTISRTAVPGGRSVPAVGPLNLSSVGCQTTGAADALHNRLSNNYQYTVSPRCRSGRNSFSGTQPGTSTTSQARADEGYGIADGAMSFFIARRRRATSRWGWSGARTRRPFHRERRGEPDGNRNNSTSRNEECACKPDDMASSSDSSTRPCHANLAPFGGADRQRQVQRMAPRHQGFRFGAPLSSDGQVSTCSGRSTVADSRTSTNASRLRLATLGPSRQQESGPARHLVMNYFTCDVRRAIVLNPGPTIAPSHYAHRTGD